MGQGASTILVSGYNYKNIPIEYLENLTAVEMIEIYMNDNTVLRVVSGGDYLVIKEVNP